MRRKGEPARVPNVDDAYHKVPATAWGNKLCAPCHDTAHGDCLGNPCDCLCRTAQPKHRKPPRDTSAQETMEKFGTIDV